MKIKTAYAARKAELNKKYREENSFEIFLKARIYRQVHKTLVSERRKMYYLLNAARMSLAYKAKYAANKEHIKARVREYARTHPEEIKEYKKKYQKSNAASIAQKKKEYYEEHKNEIIAQQSVYVTCECGKQITKCKLSRHVLSKSHLAAVGSDLNDPALAAKLERHKVNEQKNLISSSEYVTCECGQQITKSKMSRHRSTARHLKLLTTLQTSTSPSIAQQ